MVEPLRKGDPRQIGDFEIIARLGAGGMGRVWLGQNKAGSPIAVKTLHSEGTDPIALARFRREARAALQISSPWVARLYNVDLTADPPYLASEYVPGETLASRVASHGALDSGETHAFAAALADGLRAIHQAQVIHRDLSPRNIILSPEGPKIVDLGVADVEGATQLTAPGTSFGTPTSMAPEQLTGSTVNAAVDIFAWGTAVTLAATGHLAFAGERTESVVYKVVHEEPNLDGLDEELRPLVTRALAKDPTERPTAPELLDQLAELQTDALTTVTSAVSQLVEDAQLGVPEVPATIAGQAPPHPDVVRPVQPADDNTATTSSSMSRWIPIATAAAALLAIGIGVGTFMALRQDDITRPEVLSGDPPTTGQSQSSRIETSPTTSSQPSETATTPAASPSPTLESGLAGDSASSSTSDTPSLVSEINSSQASAHTLLDTASENVGEIIYLDVRFPSDDDGISADPDSAPPTVFVEGSYSCDADIDPLYCGAEYLIRDAGSETDSGFYFERGTWRLYGRFAVQTIAGPHQGVLSVNLRAVPIGNRPPSTPRPIYDYDGVQFDIGEITDYTSDDRGPIIQFDRWSIYRDGQLVDATGLDSEPDESLTTDWSFENQAPGLRHFAVAANAEYLVLDNLDSGCRQQRAAPRYREISATNFHTLVARWDGWASLTYGSDGLVHRIRLQQGC